jgi:LysR family glycine cleavage system transcriptional activator
MNHLPSLQTLRALDAAARHGSYSAAAEELGLTHGAISHRIRELEEHLHVQLFRRAGRSMAPTKEAIALLAQVREALAVLGRAFPKPVVRGEARVTIGVHPALATRWLVKRLGSFMQSYPDIALTIMSTADLADFLSPEVDIAIRYGDGGWPNASSEHLAGETRFPVCTPAYRDTHALRQPADLARATLLRHSWQPWADWLRAAQVDLKEPPSGLTVSDSAMLIEAALSGQGVALARRRFALDDLTAGRLVRPFATEVEDGYSYYLVCREGHSLSAAAALFREWLRQSFRNE